MYKKISICIMVFLFTIGRIQAQEVLEVAIVSDAAKQEDHFFVEAIKTEVKALLGSQYRLNFTEIYTQGDIQTINTEIAKVYAQNQADVLIGAGIISSKVLSEQDTFPLPAIASIQLNNRNASDTTSTRRVSGISNFTYINSPFNITEGIQVLQNICACKHLAVLSNTNLSNIGIQEEDLYPDKDVNIDWVNLSPNVGRVISQIPEEVKGVYLLSTLSAYSRDQVQLLFDQINARKLPVFTLLDKPMLELGAYASYTASENLRKIPRRIALNVVQIAEGKNPKDFPVDIASFTHQLVVNMETVHQIGKYPTWPLLDNALLININQPHDARVLSLKSAIAEGIQRNLGYQIEAKQTQISAKEVGLAKANYLPQLGIESSGLFLDENTVNGSLGTKGDFNWTAGASFSQLILSEPSLANIAIQKLLFESQQEVQNQSELDVILEVTQRFFNYIQVLSIADLQNGNIKAINQNLTIAVDKEKVGYSSSSDVHRWKTELNLAKKDLYETQAQVKAAGYSLNESLNRPIGEAFRIQKSENIDNLIAGLDEIFSIWITNQHALDRFSNFASKIARENLPEIKQLELAIAAQERTLKSNKRAFYVPTISFGASYEYPLEILNPGEPPPIPGFETAITPTWNAAVQLSFPIFSGRSRSLQKQKSEVSLYQLRDQRKDLGNLLETQVRTNVQLVNASYNNIRLTEHAAEEAGKNAAIVQDFYKSGQVDVITLVDAQNTLLGAQINATNAKYQFMIDYFTLQRSMGYYFLLDTEPRRFEFFQRFMNFNN